MNRQLLLLLTTVLVLAIHAFGASVPEQFTRSRRQNQGPSCSDGDITAHNNTGALCTCHEGVYYCQTCPTVQLNPLEDGIRTLQDNMETTILHLNTITSHFQGQDLGESNGGENDDDNGFHAKLDVAIDGVETANLALAGVADNLAFVQGTILPEINGEVSSIIKQVDQASILISSSVIQNHEATSTSLETMNAKLDAVLEGIEGVSLQSSTGGIEGEGSSGDDGRCDPQDILDTLDSYLGTDGIQLQLAGVQEDVRAINDHIGAYNFAMSRIESIQETMESAALQMNVDSDTTQATLTQIETASSTMTQTLGDVGTSMETQELQLSTVLTELSVIKSTMISMPTLQSVADVQADVDANALKLAAIEAKLDEMYEVMLQSSWCSATRRGRRSSGGVPPSIFSTD